MNIQKLIKHPENLNKDTLYELRRITALYPFYQPARLLLIKNLYLLHDSSFDEELRRAAIFFSDRRVLFDLVEAAHYRLRRAAADNDITPTAEKDIAHTSPGTVSRTVSLIDSFLNSAVAKEEANKEEDESSAAATREHRKPTPADATVDYVAYLVSSDFEELDNQGETASTGDVKPLDMNGGDLIDSFLTKDNGKITLQETVEYQVEVPIADNSDQEPDEEILTETLAGIYIKQGRFNKALDIMDRINANKTEKNPYFADQKRFLEKLIRNQSSIG